MGTPHGELGRPGSLFGGVLIGGLELPTLSLEEDWYDAWCLERLHHFVVHLGGGVWVLMSQGVVWFMMLGVRELQCVFVSARGSELV